MKGLKWGGGHDWIKVESRQERFYPSQEKDVGNDKIEELAEVVMCKSTLTKVQSKILFGTSDGGRKTCNH